MNFSSSWLTDFEKSDHLGSPRYKESMSFFKLFEKKTDFVKMSSIGTSPQGRSIECIVVAKGKEFTPEKAKKSGKLIILIQNGIHAGEIEGKDAWMMILRDILVTRKLFHLLDHIILLVIPILNVDGHEIVSPFNRPNQNGPTEMGWRTNSKNLNLNRDYLKADTPEIQAFLELFKTWLPDFFIDNHTTNGADYQYHITYGLERHGNIDSGLAEWGSTSFLPEMLINVESHGFLTAPYIQFKSESFFEGIIETPLTPRFSTGYVASQNRLGLLVETHSLKPYENRVHSTMVMNISSLEFLNKNYKQLKNLNRKADAYAARIKSIPLNFILSNEPQALLFKGFKTNSKQSSITGKNVVSYTEHAVEYRIPFYNDVRESVRIDLPKGYLIPVEFSNIVQIMRMHGIQIGQLQSDTTMLVEEYTFTDVTFSQKPYEGRQCVDLRTKVQKKRVKFIKGTYKILTNQRTNRVIVNLMEPEGPDSFVQWGFFNAFFERKEYAEAYVFEPIAQRMLQSDKELRKEFNSLLTNDQFRTDPSSRLDFFYRRSPYFDRREMKYPIYRII